MRPTLALLLLATLWSCGGPSSTPTQDPSPTLTCIPGRDVTLDGDLPDCASGAPTVTRGCYPHGHRDGLLYIVIYDKGSVVGRPGGRWVAGDDPNLVGC